MGPYNLRCGSSASFCWLLKAPVAKPLVFITEIDNLNLTWSLLFFLQRAFNTVFKTWVICILALKGHEIVLSCRSAFWVNLHEQFCDNSMLSLFFFLIIFQCIIMVRCCCVDSFMEKKKWQKVNFPLLECGWNCIAVLTSDCLYVFLCWSGGLAVQKSHLCGVLSRSHSEKNVSHNS